MNKQLFHLTEIPYNQFQQLGIHEQTVKRMFSLEDVERLLAGLRTGLKKKILIKPATKTLIVDAKFLLFRSKNNTVNLIIITRRDTISVDFGLDAPEIDRLKQGEIIKKQDPQTQELWWIQLDITTNSLLRATHTYVLSLNAKSPLLYSKPDDADYYDWEYAQYRFNTLVPNPQTVRPEINLKEYIKKIHAENMAIAQSLFDKFDNIE